MPVLKSEAIVVRSRDLRETSLMLTFYTKDFGKVHGVIKGVRGSRACYGGGAFELFAHDEIVFYERKRSEFFLVSQCDLLDFFYPIRADLERIGYAAYLIELLDSLTPLGDKNEHIFGLLLKCLELFSGTTSARRVARIFEIRLLSLLGIMPVVNSCVQCRGSDVGPARFSLKLGGVVCGKCAGADRTAGSILPGTIEFIKHVERSDLDMVSRIKVSERVGRELEALLRKFLDYHIERRLSTVTFLKSIGR